ncbi:ATP-binding protein [Flavobacterium endoglycinae]|uniref:ATP-binding protein n=1 Tax=Flavobacterium endoglycinae TaxID=2816357 RepID=A0ABX7QBY2_9FLAO|nr:ATP-binding protein [Flavobacterium endoglycinae]QSW88462.1 ATP-binding protein [Flavobacterium endoglycinae]
MQFRTKARAVDLLGKGQIADLPTAITELWKNGYDAYADNLKAELFKKGYQGLENDYFIISDDGKGMSNSDILDKWLVLGTDSKSRAELDIESEDTLWKQPRIKAGEKGIGRLSIAYVGNPMFMISKKIGYNYELVFFDWRLLENFNLFISDIVIPTKTVENLENLGDDLIFLKREFLKNFTDEKYKNYYINSNGELDDITSSDKAFVSKWDNQQLILKDEIIESVLQCDLNKILIKNFIDHFEKAKYKTGTLFLTYNPIDQILDLSEKDIDGLEDRKFVISSLTGFTNPFKGEESKVKNSFLINIKDETFDLLNSRGNFFTKDDFDLADVYIKGIFDGYGSFNGKIRIYDEVIDYVYTSSRKKDKRSFYGEIPIELGYSQGEEKSSSLTESQFKSIKDKVEEFGGLYIFRDEFRVLPYGRETADFLRFEERRSRRAGTYYFSYRRMYGYLDITRDRNEFLKDKSSREGLINNAQYRAFTNDAISFFVTLAQDYFATEAKESLFLNKKKQLNDEHEALKADKERDRKEKIAFTKSLNEYPKKLEEHQSKYENLLNELDAKLDNLNVTYSEIESILDELQILDIEFKGILPKVPKRYKPTETQKERLYKFENRLNNYFEVVAPKRELLNRKAQDKLEIRDLKIDFTKKYNSYISSLEKELNANRQTLESKADSLLKEYKERSRNLIKNLSENKDEIVNNIISKDQVSLHTDKIQDLYSSLLNQAQGTLFPLVEHINRLSFDIDEEQVQGAYKAQYDQMKYQWEQTRDTAQLGIAVEIIDHEFNQLYAKINNQINVLNNNEIVSCIKEFNYLEKNFKQLEDKYALLSPLYRISGAVTKDISCNVVFKYLLEFFENQIEEYNIKFEVSDSFKNHIIKIKEPVIHTIFINIINNAVYWMRNKEERIIKLDYLIDSNEIIIANSGEKIPDYRLDKIFDLFYTQRPNGRGIGLYLSKQSLNEAGLDIYATNNKKLNSLNGACFVINQLSSNNV